MTPQATDDRQSYSLRAITFRLTSTPVHQLPSISPHIATQLISCQQLLCAKQDDVSKENASLLHNFKTRLSSLLQDRTVEGRWAAVVILKSTIELGASQLLLADKERCAGWLRGLIGILNRPDPSSTKQLAIITLTRIFVLTREHQTLMRELTTPSLPPYITACLNHFQTGDILDKPVQRAILEPVLESFTHLVPRHPTIFRSFLTKMRNILLQILSRDPYSNAGSSSNNPGNIPLHLRDTAQKLLVQLHQCAQKAGSSEEWNLSVRTVIKSAHATTNQVFRAVSEDWESVAGVRSTLEGGQTLSDEPKQGDTDEVGLTSWSGLRSGSERLIALLNILKQYISTSGTAAVPFRIGIIVDLLSRLMYMRVPVDRHGPGYRFNNQVSRTEREELWNVLPSIHVATVEVFLGLIQRLDFGSSPCNVQLLELLPWLFESERSDLFFRAAVYKAVAAILMVTGPSLPKTTVSSLEKIMHACCSDLLRPTRGTEIDSSRSHLQNGNKSGQQSTATNGSALISTTSIPSSDLTGFPGLVDAADSLLPILLGKLPAQHVSVPVRTDLDRVAVLIAHSAALTASVLNPSPHKPSLLPLMATLCPTSLDAEGLLRPRMPVIRTSSRDQTEDELDEEADIVGTNGFNSLKADFSAAAHDQPAQNINAAVEMAVDGAKPESLDVPPPAEKTETKATTPLAAALTATTSTKRPQEEEPPAFSAPKRVRHEKRVFVKDVPTAVVPVSETTSYIANTTAREAEVAMGQADDSDSDGSDFEIPKLHLKTASEAEEDEEDY